MGADTRVFVSYSRVDEGLVTPVVRLMRAIGGTVFQDVDSIPAGKRWRFVIEESIDDSSMVVLFWCAHTKGSAAVRAEWERGIHGGKDVIPALLDDTPLETLLAEFQWIDLRTVVRHEASRENLGVLPVSDEQWKRLHLDRAAGNHLRAPDVEMIRTAADSLVAAIRQRSQRS